MSLISQMHRPKKVTSISVLNRCLHSSFGYCGSGFFPLLFDEGLGSMKQQLIPLKGSVHLQNFPFSLVTWCYCCVKHKTCFFGNTKINIWSRLFHTGQSARMTKLVLSLIFIFICIHIVKEYNRILAVLHDLSLLIFNWFVPFVFLNAVYLH